MVVINTDGNFMGCGKLTTTVLGFNDECIGRGQLTMDVVWARRLSY